jgi:hypothetical protein
VWPHLDCKHRFGATYFVIIKCAGPFITSPKHTCSLNFLPCTLEYSNQNQHIGSECSPNTPSNSFKCRHPKLHKIKSSSPWMLLNSACSQTYYFSNNKWAHSRLGYYFWVSNGLRTFFDNFTYLVCMDMYCGAYFGSYLLFILHIEYNDKVNLQGTWSSMISF